MKYLILIALVSISAAQAKQHDFGNGNCRECNGGEWSPSTTVAGGWACSGTAGPLEICGKAVIGRVVADPRIDLGAGSGGPRKAVTSPASSKLAK